MRFKKEFQNGFCFFFLFCNGDGAAVIITVTASLERKEVDKG